MVKVFLNVDNCEDKTVSRDSFYFVLKKYQMALTVIYFFPVYIVIHASTFSEIDLSEEAACVVKDLRSCTHFVSEKTPLVSLFVPPDRTAFSLNP